jgi:uncharacterized membrane protein YfcA
VSDLSTVLYVIASFVVSGLVKGAAGLGLPLVALPLLSFALPLKTAVALVIVPIFITNVAQSVQGGLAMPIFRRFWQAWLAIGVVIAISAQALVAVNEKVLYGIIGTTLILLTITLRYRPSLQVQPAQERWASPLVAGIGGVLGGFTGIYGPPYMLYLAGLRMKKNEFVAAISQYFVAGNIGLTIGLLGFGGATLRDLAFSAAATLPAYAGMWVGQRIQSRLDERGFAGLLYVLYLAMGASFLARTIG